MLCAPIGVWGFLKILGISWHLDAGHVSVHRGCCVLMAHRYSASRSFSDYVMRANRRLGFFENSWNQLATGCRTRVGPSRVLCAHGASIFSDLKLQRLCYARQSAFGVF